jgi:beta-1,4-mannosyl-glycoprotein beta-1,4-N-acetylglucosaminyltransferase
MVYDCFIYFNELDLLEIRLNELDGVVDKFVIVEADRTFQNQPKPFIFEENLERFAKFQDKIIHVKLTKYPLFIPIINPFSPWKLEFYQRNSILKGLKGCKPNDIILISDIDEIPRASVLKEYLDKGVDRIYGLKMDMFMYFFNHKLIYDKESRMTKEESKDGIWFGTAMMPYRLLKQTPVRIRKTLMRTLRRKQVYDIIPNGGWHFTFMGGFNKIKQKLEAFSHTEYNLDTIKDEEFIANCLKNGKDILGRNMEFEVMASIDSLPEYLKREDVQQKFSEHFYNK